MLDLSEISRRSNVPKYTKYEKDDYTGHVVKHNTVKLYDYYKCDYCGGEIKILPKKQEMTGETVKITHLVTKQGDIEIALHNKCLNPVLKIFEEEKK